ncbi:hypothetical protein FJT64_026879 [Amphibalanus amphitrite]|uniref:Apolipoprotein D n=1 Tax=Amphibalanus amphitrite TaxID=1232801 RepID=A0A6A4WA41_AMPAM|nr:hypothetical protein FJT64_026879 [Amphibalanus amphitrite]
MERTSVCFVLLICTAGLCLANYSELGLCPSTPRQADLRPDRLAGVWYEQMRYFDPGFSARCTRWQLSRSDGDDGALRLNETRLDAVDGSRYETVETVRPAGGADQPLSSPRFDHIVVAATDYTAHAVVLLCRQHRGFHARTVLVLTRQRAPERRRLRALLDRLRADGLLVDRLVQTAQDNCPDGGP